MNVELIGYYNVVRYWLSFCGSKDETSVPQKMLLIESKHALIAAYVSLIFV